MVGYLRKAGANNLKRALRKKKFSCRLLIYPIRMRMHNLPGLVKVYAVSALKLSAFPKRHNNNEPVHGISNNMVCATSKASDQAAHTRSLIRAFASRLSIL